MTTDEKVRTLEAYQRKRESMRLAINLIETSEYGTYIRVYAPSIGEEASIEYLKDDILALLKQDLDIVSKQIESMLK